MKTKDSSNACPKCGATVPPEAPQGLCPQCVFAAAAAPEAAPTATSQIPSLERLAVAFPQLQIIELIGRGGMGFVFKARQPHLDRFVALKLLPDSLAHDPQFAERFNREGRVLARLNHPNIVSIFDFGYADPRRAALPSRSSPDLVGRVENSPAPPASAAAAAQENRAPSDGGFYYLMMEYVDGVNLRQAMQAGRFSPAEALTIVPKICEALQFAHEEGILHRDIKPENILLDAKGRVKIADFGIAKLVGEEHPDVSLTATGAALGTMHYMAPEQIEKPSTVDHRADIYSLGVVFYELLTGELPLGRFGPPSAKTPVDSRVDDVVMRTLEREREKRFQSAGEMGTTVEHLTEVGAGSFKAAPPKVPGVEPQRGPGGTMKIPAAPRPTRFLFPYRRAAIAGVLLLALIVSGTAVVNMFLPKTYSAKATLTHASFDNPSEANRLLREIISGPVLNQVITDLDLKNRTSFRSESGPMSNERVMLMLRNRLTTSHPNGTTLCDVRAFSESPEEAAQLANAVVSTYCARNEAAQIIERAENSTRPIRPNRARNIAIAFAIGIPIAIVGGILFGLWSAWRTKRQTPGRTIAIKAEKAGTPVPAWSLKAVWGAVMVGVSLVPITALASLAAYFAVNRRNFVSFSAIVWIVASLSLSLPAIAGTILGWMGLSDVSREEKRGAVFAIFASLFWPVILLAAFTVWIVAAPIMNFAEMAPFASLLLLLVPAGTVTFITWAIGTTVYKATGQPTFQRRGVLRWVFAAVLVSGIGLVIAPRVARTSSQVTTPPVSVADTNATPWIRFTFTAVELREVQGVRWLAIDYLDDVHGECEKSFPWEATIPGFKPTTRTSEFLGGDANAPVRHQRVEYRMPDSIHRDPLERLRDQVARTLERKSFRLEVGEEKLLFEMIPMTNGLVMLAPPEGVATAQEMADIATGFGGSFKARIKVVPPLQAKDLLSPRKLQLRIPTITDDPHKSVGVTTDSELPVGDYLVGLLQRPDGRLEEKPAVVTIYRGSGRTSARAMKHLLWSMSLFESNRVREILVDMRASLDGRVIELLPDRHSSIFKATNVHGAVTEGFIAFRSQSLPATHLPPVTVSIVDVPKNWGSFLSVKIRVSAPPGYFPNAVGLLDDGSELETHTSIMGGGRGSAWSGDACSWYFPGEFQATDVQEIIRQLESTKVTSPNGIVIPPGQRVPMFSVTNKTGAVFRGYFEVPMTTGTK